MTLVGYLLHPEMPECRILSFMLHMYLSSPAFNKAACSSAYLEWGFVYVDPVANMSSALPTDPSISKHCAHSAISSSYASLTWVLHPVLAGVRILPLLFIPSRQRRKLSILN